MIDLSVKLATAAAIAWLVTRRVTPASAAAAHRLWLAVLATPALWAIGASIWQPVAYLVPRAGLVPVEPELPAGFWTVALLLYAAGAAALLARTAAGVVSVQRLLRRSHCLKADDLARLQRLAGRDTLDIREADVDVPVTAGFVRPAVLLPPGWQSMPPAGLTAVLRHEAAHVRRRDCVIALVCALLEAAFWWHPAVWLAASQVRRLAEIACDAEAARDMGGREYASELLRVAAEWRDCRRPTLALTSGAGTRVAERIRLLLDEIEHGRRRRILIPIATLMLLAALLPSAAIQVAPAPPGAIAAESHRSHGAAHSLRHERHSPNH